MRHCIIGAGFSGLPIARHLKALDENFVVYDKNSGIGGLWHTGVYRDAHIISSRNTTQYPEWPMPADYPDFPSKAQMQAYFEAYAKHFGLDKHIELNTEVLEVAPTTDAAPDRRWRITLKDGREEYFSSVAICNGHHWSPRHVEFPGKFDGDVFHSVEYNTNDRLAGKHVLVVGYGNTGCDIAVDASRVGKSSTISMRSGSYFFPKSIFGIPLADILYTMPVHHEISDRLVAKFASVVAVGDLARFGVPKVTRNALDRHPIINTELVERIRHGRINVKPNVDRFDGKTVHFVDGTAKEFDAIVLATGYKCEFPMLREKTLLDWKGDRPILFMQLMSPKNRGLFFPGLGQARTGGGPIYQRMGAIFARLMAAEARSKAGVKQDLEAQLLPRVKRPLTFPASFRSRGLGELYRGITRFEDLCDKIGAPRIEGIGEQNAAVAPMKWLRQIILRA